MVLLITAVAFLLRTATLSGQSLWRDEVDAIRFSDWPLRELIGGLFQAGHNGPLFFLLLRPWRTLTGDSEFALRYPSALWGTVAVPLGFVLARQLGLSRRAGVLFGLLLATSPYLVWYGQEAKMYAMLGFMVTLAFVAYLKTLANSGPRWWLVFVAATSLSFYLHILSPLMLGVYGLVGLGRWSDLRRHWRGWLISLACLTLPYVPLIVWQFSFFWSGADRGHPFYPLRQEISILLELYTSGLLRFTGSTAMVLYVFLLLGGLFLPHARADAEKITLIKRGTLVVWLLLPPLAVYLISLRVPIFEDRYLIYITPAFYLLVVVGLLLLRHHSRLLAGLALGLMLTINLLGVWLQQRGPIKADFRAAADYLASQSPRPAAIMIQMPYLQYTLDYYYPYPYQFIGGLWTNDGKSEATVETTMQQQTAALADLWLVISEEETWDQRRLVRSWLDQNAELVDQASFRRVDLYHYRLQPGLLDDPLR